MNPYGASKLAAEEAVAEPRRAAGHPHRLALRPRGRNFVSKIVAAAQTARKREIPFGSWMTMG